MSLTCVSAQFPVKNKHGSQQLTWFQNTLSINCPQVFFVRPEDRAMIESFRKGLPTQQIECDIPEFVNWKYKGQMMTHPTHLPSEELAMIWNEKVFMIQKAAELNPFQSEWFQWIDAGVCVYRTQKPPPHPYPNPERLASLPKDRFLQSSSQPQNPARVSKTIFYHHIAGTSFLLHRDFIPRWVPLYQSQLDRLIDKQNIWMDQVIFTHIQKDHPELFQKVCDGQGEIVRALF